MFAQARRAALIFAIGLSGSLAAPAFAWDAAQSELRPTPVAQSGFKRGSVLTDKVTRVRDGDTIVVGRTPIRIANLNCDEAGSRRGNLATSIMRGLVQGQVLSCRLEGRKSYDREVGVCALSNGADIGEIMIREGYCRRWR